MDGERTRSEGNASEYDTDLECEEEEAGSAHSDCGATEGPLEDQQGARVAGRKRLHSEASSELAPSSGDAKCRQASNLHNEREKERRKDLKQAVHRLRNQLQLNQTKKATTIRVLKASEQEIKDLMSMEEAQNRELTDLQTRHKHLTWKLENLMAEQKRDASRSETSAGSNSSPAPILSSPLPGITPPLSSVAPVFYMPSTPSATARSPSIAASCHPPSLMMQPHRSISPSTFPFGSYSAFPHSSLLSPTPVFPPMPTAAHPHHGFSVPARPFLVMSPASPQSFAFPSFLPRLPGTPGQFVFPSGPGTPSPHLPSPSSLLLHTFSPQGPMAPPLFPVFLPQPRGSELPLPSNPISKDPESSTPQASPAVHGEHTFRGDSPASRQTSDSPESSTASDESWKPRRGVDDEWEFCSQSSREATQREGHTAQRRDSAEVIDVETPDQEEMETQHFLGLRCPHRKQRKRQERRKIPRISTMLEKTNEMANQMEPPPISHIVAGKNKVSKNAPSEDPVTSQDLLRLRNRGLLFKETVEALSPEERCRLWQRKEQTSPSVLDLAPPRLSTVICS